MSITPTAGRQTPNRSGRCTSQAPTSRGINAKLEVPCSYDEYCRIRSDLVSPDTRENFRIMDSSAKMLERYSNGERQVTVEYLSLIHI